MYLLLLTIIIITLVVISACISANNTPPFVLQSLTPLVITSKENISLSSNIFNLSVHKNSNGYSGLIRSVTKSSPQFSYPYHVTIDHDGYVQQLSRVNLDYNNFNKCVARYRNIFANGIEDSRLFLFRGEEWAISNCLGSSQQVHPCINAMCIFRLSDPRDSFRVLFPPADVDPLQVQKNWSPFEWNDKMLCEYTLNPHEILEIDVDTGKTQSLFTSGESCVDIRHGHALRGGAPPILIGDVYLGIGHSRAPSSSDYYHFFYTFESKPPFTIQKISRQFKLETSNLIQFVAGLSLYEDKICVSYGVSDKHNRISCYDLSSILEFINSDTNIQPQ